MLEGPEPRTDREFLVQIFQKTRNIELSVNSLCARVDKNDQQIELLQKWRWGVTGGIAVIGMLVTWIAGHVKGWF